MSVKHIHGGDVFGAAETLGLKQSEILDFSANINPLGPPPGVFESISQSMHLIVNYPDPLCRELKQALSDYLGINKNYIIIGNGVSELIYLLVRSLSCRRALIPVPTFTEYGLAVITSGGIVEEVPLVAGKGFILDAEKIVSSMSPGDLIFICNPNNPTGNLHPRDMLQYLLEKAESRGAFLVLDEAFIDFVPDIEASTMIPMVEQSPNLIVFYSLTKFFGIPGLRLGAMLGSPKLVKQMVAAKDPWNVNLFAQAGGVAALKDKKHMQRTRELVRIEGEYLYNKLAGLPGLKPYRGQANFLFVDIMGSGFTSVELTELMRQRGVLIRDCSSFQGLGNNHIRLAVKSRGENDRLIAELGRVLEGARL